MLVIVYIFNFIDRNILSILAEDIKADLEGQGHVQRYREHGGREAPVQGSAVQPREDPAGCCRAGNPGALEQVRSPDADPDGEGGAILARACGRVEVDGDIGRPPGPAGTGEDQVIHQERPRRGRVVDAAAVQAVGRLERARAGRDLVDDPRASGAGVALDVYAEEPYQGPLRNFERCLLTPHIGSMTSGCRAEMERDATLEILRVFAGEAVLGAVPEFEYEGQNA